jgi:hypothetical protein
MAAWLIANWVVFASVLGVCAGYILFKVKGGNLLFRIKKTDDGTTQAMKAVVGFGWAIGSVMVAWFVGIVAFLLLVASGIAALVS